MITSAGRSQRPEAQARATGAAVASAAGPATGSPSSPSSRFARRWGAAKDLAPGAGPPDSQGSDLSWPEAAPISPGRLRPARVAAPAEYGARYGVGRDVLTAGRPMCKFRLIGGAKKESRHENVPSCESQDGRRAGRCRRALSALIMGTEQRA